MDGGTDVCASLTMPFSVSVRAMSSEPLTLGDYMKPEKFIVHRIATVL